MLIELARVIPHALPETAPATDHVVSRRHEGEEGASSTQLSAYSSSITARLQHHPASSRATATAAMVGRFLRASS